jgi:hypothetical protein
MYCILKNKFIYFKKKKWKKERKKERKGGWDLCDISTRESLGNICHRFDVDIFCYRGVPETTLKDTHSGWLVGQRNVYQMIQSTRTLQVVVVVIVFQLLLLYIYIYICEYRYSYCNNFFSFLFFNSIVLTLWLFS